MNAYYVYEHWRPDTNEPFYVGKGRGRRAREFSNRGAYHKNIVAKLARLGYDVHVRILANGLTSEEATSREIERIAFWRGKGIALINLTTGGEGTPGYCRPHTQITKDKISAGNRGKKRSAAQILVMRAISLGKSPSIATRLKISEAGRGRKMPPEAVAKTTAALRGRVVSERTRTKISASKSGVKQSPNDVAKRAATCRATWAARKITKKCQNCGETFKVKRTAEYQVFCSRACFYAARRGKKRTDQFRVVKRLP